MTSPSAPTASLKPFLVTVLVCSAVSALYAFLELEPQPFVALVVTVAPLVSAVNWIKADARERRVSLVHDVGLFLWLTWPALIPWYAVKTRGRHAWVMALVILVAIVAPVLLAALIGVGKALGARAQ